MKTISKDEPHTIEVPYPFVMQTFGDVDKEGRGFSDESWRPGTKRVPDLSEDLPEWAMGAEIVIAQGMGHMLLQPVRRVELPGPFRARIFFVRQWRDPDGRVFGKRALRCLSVQAFGRLRAGYRYIYELRS